MSFEEMKTTVSTGHLQRNYTGKTITRKAQWVFTCREYGAGADYKITFTMKDAYRDSLKLNTIDATETSFNGEAHHPNFIIIKPTTEPGAYGISINRIAGFNSNIIEIYTEVKRPDGWTKCQKEECKPNPKKK
jgi:hypothetical protein